jgi:iron complex transport system permease protein
VDRQHAYGEGSAPHVERTRLMLLLFGALLIAAVVVSLAFGRGMHGWQWTDLTQTIDLASLRGPRMLGALAAGAMLAVAGVLIQRMTGNPMASPELLGIGGAAAVGLTAVLSLASNPTTPLKFAAMAAAAAVALAFIITVSRRSNYSPDYLLVAGVAVGGFLNVVTLAATTTGDPRLSVLKMWMAGATDLIAADQAILAAVAAVIALAGALVSFRWLDILPLGAEVSQAVGVNVRLARLLILLLTAGVTAAATLLIGPLGFVGLMAPHIVRLAGLRRPAPQLFGAAFLGAAVLVSADWLGRNLLFPYLLPAGLLATLVGGAYVLVLIRQRNA